MMMVIFDLDGTVALIDHRRHWLDKAQHPEMNSEQRWRQFFAECVNDQPNVPVVTILRALHGRLRITIWSARSDEVRAETETWLAVHQIPYDELRMRAAGDHTPDETLKRTWLAETGHKQIAAVFDDRNKVVAMWRAHGIACFQVALGAF